MQEQRIYASDTAERAAIAILGCLLSAYMLVVTLR
jgi:hypothetical protein